MGEWGIYLNTETKQVRRIGIGISPPTDRHWVQLSDDPNMTLVAIRELTKSRGLVSNPEDIQWE